MRLRAPFACQSGCALCSGASANDADALAALLEHAETVGQRRLYLQGTDVSQARHLPAIVRAAQRRSVQLALVEEGNRVDLPAAARALRQMGIDRVYVSLDGFADGPEASGDSDPRKPVLAALLALSRAGDIDVGVHLPLSPRNVRALPAVLRLQTRLSIRELLISEVLDDRGPECLPAADAVAALDRAWLAANRQRVRLQLIGFERTQHADPLPIGAPAPACDRTLLETIRRGIPLTAPRAGIAALGTPSNPSSLQDLAGGADGLKTLGLELAARGCPFVDLPACFGGVLPVAPAAPDTHAARFVKSDACAECRNDAHCPGVPEQLDGIPTSALRAAARPLPIWYELPRPPRILILSSHGQDLVFYGSTLPGLAHALSQRGATVEIVSPWLSRCVELPREVDDLRFQKRWKYIISEVQAGRMPEQPRRARRLFERAAVWVQALLSGQERWTPDWQGTSGAEKWLASHDLSRFDLVIASDLPIAQLVLAAGSLRPSARLVVLDFHMLKGMDDAVATWLGPSARPTEGGWWPSPQMTLETGFPGYVKLYINYGVPLEHVAWRPFPLDPGHFPPGPGVHDCCVIMSGGNHLRDLDTLRAATERLSRDVHPVVLFDQGERFAGNARLLHEGAVPLRSFYHALSNSRFVVVPLREDTHRAAGVTVLAMALMAGRPVVATGITAVRDYIHHGVEGLLVPPADPAALAEAITRLDKDPALLSTLAAGALKAGQRLSTVSWAEQIISGTATPGPIWTDHGWRNW